MLLPTMMADANEDEERPPALPSLSMLPCVQPSASAQRTVFLETLGDSFDSGGFEGNDGSIEWSGPWTHVAGLLLHSDPNDCATGSCLRLTAAHVVVGLVSRGADLSGFSTGTLSFVYKANHIVGNGKVDVVAVASKNGNMYTLGGIPSSGKGQVGCVQYVIPADHLTADFRLEFRATADEGSWTDIIVDNVVLTIQHKNGPTVQNRNDPHTALATGALAQEPTYPPSRPTPSPTLSPTRHPTRHPTGPPPTRSPTSYPTNYPTLPPTKEPTRYPTAPPNQISDSRPNSISSQRRH